MFLSRIANSVKKITRQSFFLHKFIESINSIIRFFFSDDSTLIYMFENKYPSIVSRKICRDGEKRIYISSFNNINIISRSFRRTFLSDCTYIQYLKKILKKVSLYFFENSLFLPILH